VAREMAMIKVRVDRTHRSQIIELADIFKAEIVDVAPESIIIEATGEEHMIDNLVELLKDYEVIELVRTGRVAMLRGVAVSHPHEEDGEEQYERAPGVHTW
ncbi:MAG: acetolactate synthase small subunit, partial [Chloroflexi bacterium]